MVIVLDDLHSCVLIYTVLMNLMMNYYVLHCFPQFMATIYSLSVTYMYNVQCVARKSVRFVLFKLLIVYI